MKSQYASTFCIYLKGMEEKKKEKTRWRKRCAKKPQNEGETDTGILSTIKMIEVIWFCVMLLLCLVNADVVMTKKIQHP